MDILIFKAENDPVVSAYFNRPESGILTFQQMQPGTGIVHILNSLWIVQKCKDKPDFTYLSSR